MFELMKNGIHSFVEV